jgi:hypothetical protein
MTSVSDIMAYAWDKDAVNLKASLDTVMTDRIADQIDAMRVDYAASMFGATNGETMEEVEDNSSYEDTEELDSGEGTHDENV